MVNGETTEAVAANLLIGCQVFTQLKKQFVGELVIWTKEISVSQISHHPSNITSSMATHCSVTNEQPEQPANNVRNHAPSQKLAFAPVCSFWKQVRGDSE